LNAVTQFELTLPARPENVAVVRHAFGGLGETLEVREQLLADIKLAVTEACSNVVVHAYPEHVGLLEVEAKSEEGQIVVWVRDFGRGITQPTQHPGLGLGLGLMASVSDVFEAYPGFLRGTTVVMRFELARRDEDEDEEPEARAEDERR
jgi:anti-sigma regulatory factor (Ser/Thr protein kinase)